MSELDPSALASDIAARVAAATSLRVAVFGLLGVVIGVLGTFLRDYLQDRHRRKLDKGRKEMLLEMLRDNRFPKKWRAIATMSRVVGADEEVTKRLLIEVGARGSEKDDGLWGLIEYHPFDKVDQ